MSKRTKKRSSRAPSGRLASGLREHQRLRNEQRYLLTAFAPLVDAFDEQLKRLDALIAMPGLHPEIANLIRIAIDGVISGVDRLMSIGEPHNLEEARLLMEVDFLLRDFAAVPANVEVWSSLPDFERNQQFGFGKLRDREERRQNLPTDVALPEKAQWTTHSVHSHPLPLKDHEPPLRHASFSLLSSVGDLFDHLMTVEVSARRCVEALVGSLPENYDEQPLTATAEFESRVNEVLTSHLTDEERSALVEPRPKREVTPKYWQRPESTRASADEAAP